MQAIGKRRWTIAEGIFPLKATVRTRIHERDEIRCSLLGQPGQAPHSYPLCESSGCRTL